jgi:molybdenum cofactor synthesis domain-containing protein
MQVALVSVGDELLAGDTVNTNAAWLGDRLTERGVAVERVVVVPDRVADIARVVNELRAEYEAVLVTGGLGPTHDDLTMEGVAAAFGTDLEHSEAALEWLTEHGGYEREDLTEGTADIPRGARMLPNEVGVAPGAVVDGVYVFPGVPSEMKAMFEHVADEFEGTPTYTETVVTSEPESHLVGRLVEVQKQFDVTVGSYPGESVKLRVRADDAEEAAAAAAWLREQVEVLEPDDEDEG